MILIEGAYLLGLLFKQLRMCLTRVGLEATSLRWDTLRVWVLGELGVLDEVIGCELGEEGRDERGGFWMGVVGADVAASVTDGLGVRGFAAP